MRVSFGHRTPWGDQDSPALVTAVENALEHALSVRLMHGAARPRVSSIPAGTELVRQGDAGTEIYLVLDGVIGIERDGSRLAEYGPGALLGERAALEGGSRTSTLVAVTPCRVASAPAPAAQLDASDLAELATGHRREDTAQREDTGHRREDLARD
jgi:signal-transduction protein with cAMP-binding, CBS, and nucleotidyltransferase domain